MAVIFLSRTATETTQHHYCSSLQTPPPSLRGVYKPPWQLSSDRSGNLDCRVGLWPSRNDGVSPGIANTSSAIVRRI